MTKVLLVDDETEFVSALAERLSFRDLEADWTDNSADALQMAENEDYDIAVLDVMMPGLGGIDLMRRIQEVKTGMQFIFLTGHGSSFNYREGAEGATFYLPKPLKIETLVEKINQALSKR